MTRDDDVEVPNIDSPYTSDITLVQHLLKTNSDLSEDYIVKNWLQEIAPPAYPVETRKGYWFYTKRSIKDQKTRSFLQSQSDTIVTEVDPDAPTRQRKNLELDDAVYERNLTKTLFEYIRRGRIDDAIDLCIESDQPWRAASLRGGHLHHDPSLS
ncbi:nuclear pore protein 84/107 [Endogone sp. FLAS-F59071]|nr:nuclear pore protein 84/107 [Endogone sp. FLAS-F59071]|eukprot:RUS17285.1 nuclear pore protein 84/107 [Endogone sp. FLAS-F59071]